ncbi:glycerophosphodiester phosphodiesterase 1 isoform X1 [Esox lucius]|uniref:Glycerophosphodiester phosphodiesterase 1 n=1 Tax=Esox lucius TaxID=8010 RepID=A0A3P8Z4H1_ESOLU|nr:glycerophosphodiester phosphodiesterase 1 isoform X1 [Esox lucius]
MLQVGDELTLFSVVFVGTLLGTRSPIWSTALTACLYAFLILFRFPQVPSMRARQVLRPTKNAAAGGVSIVAHRGGGHDAPENTIAAIREAHKNGATGVELDLEFTSDGVPILMHDETVDRTTNGSGPLAQLSFSELSKLDAAAKHRLSDRFQGEKIPMLLDAVEECIKLQLTIYFDVKGHPDEAAAAFKELYQKHPILYNTSIVCSFEPKVIYKPPVPLPDFSTLTPDATGRPGRGHGADPPAVEPVPVRGRSAALLVAMETPLDAGVGRHSRLGSSSPAMEALRGLGFPGAEELHISGLCPVLGPERGGVSGLDCQHSCGETILPGDTGYQLHH